MPSFNTPVLPSTPGLALGSPSMPWSIFSTQTVAIFGNTVVNTIPWSATPILDASSASAIEIVLSGDVTAATFVSSASTGYVQLVVFYITQDATGGRKWTWPGNFHGCQNVDGVNLVMAANQVMVQTVYWSGTRNTGVAASPAVFFP
jgi:hypothetical protein